MTRRGALRRLALAGTVATASLGGLSGCDPRMAMYFLQPFEPQIPPPCPALKGKRVVLIGKTVPGATNDFVNLDRELTRQVATALRSGVKKIDLVELDRVWDWDQAHPTWTDPAELARAFEADMVVVLEIGQFQIQSPSSPGMYEGKSAVQIRVVEYDHPKDDRGKPLTDLPKEANSIYDDNRDTTFPLRGPMPASSEVSPTAFKNKFLKLVATEISWHFVPHAPGDNIQDVKFQHEQ
jgi:hypothetical protein